MSIQNANTQGAVIDIRASITRRPRDTATRRKPRSPQGSDPYCDPQTLSDMKRAQSRRRLHRDENRTLSKIKVTDLGETEIEITAFVEQDACLLTVRNWDAVPDQETCLRTQIIPIFDTLNFRPKPRGYYSYSRQTANRYDTSPRPPPRVSCQR